MTILEYLNFLEQVRPSVPVIITIPTHSPVNSLIKELTPPLFNKVIDVIEGRILNTEGLDRIFKALCLNRAV